MNIAGKGVLLIIAVIAMGIIVLNEGFDNEASSTFSEPVRSDQQEQSQEEPNQEEQQVAESNASEQTDTEQNAGDAQTEESQTTSTSVLHPEEEVRVLVANGTDVTGAAGATLDTLVANAGYNGVQAVNDTGDEILPETLIYYGQGYDLDAQNIRLIINANRNNVFPMPEILPVEDLVDANVLVHASGYDLHVSRTMTIRAASHPT